MTLVVDPRKYWNWRSEHCNWLGGAANFGRWVDVIRYPENSVPRYPQKHNYYRKESTDFSVEPVTWYSGITWKSSPQVEYPVNAGPGGVGYAPWPTPVEIWSQMAAEVRGHQLNAAVAYAELSKTLDHLTTTARRVIDFARYLKMGNVIGALKAVGFRPVEGKRRVYRNKRTKHVLYAKKVSPGFDPGSLWLEYKYAWLPLYSDIYETFRAVHAATNKPRLVEYEIRVKKRGVASASARKFLVNESSRQTKLTLLGEDGWAPLDAKGLENPELVAWELVPFSFVFDWFMPIGSWLDARGFLRTLCGWKYYQTDKEKYRWEMDIRQQYAGRFITNPTQACYKTSWYLYSRGNLNTITWNTWTHFQLPTFTLPGESNMSWARAATSLALLAPSCKKLYRI